MQFQYEWKRIKRVKKNQAGLGKACYKVTSAFPYHLDKYYAKVMVEDQQSTDGPGMPSIEVIEYVVDVPHDEMEEKDSFHMIVISHSTPEYNEKMLESTEKECLFGSGTSSVP
jgi:glycerate-2-kinase